jgi:hypothetical protein
MVIRVPFFIRFGELEKLLREKFGNYEIIDIFQRNGRWEIVIEKVNSAEILGEGDTYHKRNCHRLTFEREGIIGRQRLRIINRIRSLGNRGNKGKWQINKRR